VELASPSRWTVSPKLFQNELADVLEKPKVAALRVSRVVIGNAYAADTAAIRKDDRHASVKSKLWFAWE
jgi:hypothetical protein